MSDQFQHLSKVACEVFDLHLHSYAAFEINVDDTSGVRLYSVYSDDGWLNEIDQVFICTGHSENRDTALSKSVYLIHEKLSHLKDSKEVLLEGLGVSAIDIISELTVGRGGKFDVCANGLNYSPSGNEPRIYI